MNLNILPENQLVSGQKVIFFWLEWEPGSVEEGAEEEGNRLGTACVRALDTFKVPRLPGHALAHEPAPL